MTKPKIATVFLSGCFGCHMTILDIDERLEKLAEIVDLDKSPLTDKKAFDVRCRIGIIEGGCANEEHVRVLRDLRAHCDFLIAMGECALQGDIPSMRNMVPLKECFDEAYLHGPSVYNPEKFLPADPELPLLLDRVYPCQEVVEIDYFIPGCSPRSDAVWNVVNAALLGKPAAIEYGLLKYD